MKRRIRWENIIPKPIQRLQSKYYSYKELFIETDYEYDKPNESIEEREQHEREQLTPNNHKAMYFVLLGILFLFFFLYILPTLTI